MCAMNISAEFNSAEEHLARVHARAHTGTRAFPLRDHIRMAQLRCSVRRIDCTALSSALERARETDSPRRK